MSETLISGHTSITIGTIPITLTMSDINQTPKVFSLPEGQTVDVNLGDLNAYLKQELNVPKINFAGIKQTNLRIKKFYISSAGVFDMAVDFVFGDGEGWNIFPGLTLHEVGFEVSYKRVPNIVSIVPASGPVGTTLTLTGSDLGNATKVDIGGAACEIVPNSNTQASIQVKVPQLAASVVQVVLTNALGTSTPDEFTVAAA